jgi:hypothetical protein
MTKILAGIAALTLMSAAALPLKASAAEQKPGISKEVSQPTDVSAQRRHYRHRYYARHHYWGPRRHWGPRYGYGYPYPYGAYGYPYGYYRPGFALGVGPFGFRVF